jgi:hypothetical protein
MKPIAFAFVITFLLIGLTAFLAWEAHQEARGARREVEWFRQQQNEQLAAGATPMPGILDGVNRGAPLQTFEEEQAAAAAAGAAPAPTGSVTAGAAPDVADLKPPAYDPDEGTLPARMSPDAGTSAEDEPLTAYQRQLALLPAIARVKQAFNQDGFVLIDAGTAKELSAGMQFDVRRGSSRVGRVTLTDGVEADEAIADIQPRFIPRGVELRAGDELVQVVDGAP